jgi:hypothetical protein
LSKNGSHIPVFNGAGETISHPLTVLFGGAPYDFSGHEGLTQSDLVGDDHSAVGLEDPKHPRHALALETGETHHRLESIVLRRVPIELPEHPQKHQPGLMRLPSRPVQAGEVVRVGFVPQSFEPGLDQVRVLG